MPDDLLLTQRERFGRFWRFLSLGSAPSLVLALLILIDDAVVAGVVAGLGVFVALSIATSVRSNRAALVAGTVVAIGLLVMQIVIAWMSNHPILPGE
jgi:hypothetical protein